MKEKLQSLEEEKSQLKTHFEAQIKDLKDQLCELEHKIHVNAYLVGDSLTMGYRHQ